MHIESGYLIFIIGLFITWNCYLHKSIFSKASRESLRDLKNDLEKSKDEMKSIKDSIWENFATKEDIRDIKGQLQTLTNLLIKGTRNE